jgi:protein-S-isoprenylcysteine O-methyltransferase Ste14
MTATMETDIKTDTPELRALLGWLATTTLLVAVTALFALAHWQHWRRTGDFKGMVFAAQELVVVVIALARRRPSAVSHRPADWVVAIIGSYAVLLLRPGGTASASAALLGTGMQIAGAIAACVCLFELGRSFGVVAANRGIKSRGPYALVRHPIYAAYAVATIGYLVSAPTVWNLAVVAVALGAQLRRITAEEAVLTESSEYREYAQRVPWRLIPGVI